MNKLYEYLKSQFSIIEEARVFMWKFVNEMGQSLPMEGYEEISTRSLSAHCSRVLEGKTDHPATDTNYLSEKHGSDLYFAAWSRNPLLPEETDEIIEKHSVKFFDRVGNFSRNLARAIMETFFGDEVKNRYKDGDK